MSSTRHGEARSALREVQSRYQDIQKIEKTIRELASLFQEMSVMIEMQETQIDDIETHAQTAQTALAEGNEETQTAIKTIRSTRRKKWWCLGIVVLIIGTRRECPSNV